MSVYTAKKLKPAACELRISLSLRRVQGIWRFEKRRPNLTVCFVLEDEKLMGIHESEEDEESGGVGKAISLAEKVAVKVARKKSERFSYLVAAVMSSFGAISISIMAVYYRFAKQMEVSPAFVRGTYGSFTQIATCLGLMAALLIGIPTKNDPSWRRVCFWVSTIPAALLAILMEFSTESPH